MCIRDRHGLGAAGLTRVFCEGGGQLAASLLAAGLVDELICFTAGMALGADGRLALAEVRPVGADVMSVWRRV